MIDLLAIGPHPDDVELACGGWLALAADRGQRTGVVDLTRGELATNGSVEVRASEATAAAEVLGVGGVDVGKRVCHHATEVAGVGCGKLNG